MFLAGAGGLGGAIFADTQFRSNVVVAGGLCVLLAVVLDLLVLAVQKAADSVDAGGGDMTTTLAALGEFGDAIGFIFSERENQRGVPVGGSHNLPLLWEHLKLSGAAMAIALVIALPLGLMLGHTGKGSFLAISTSNVGRAVPSVALIALFIAFFPGSPEFVNVTLALAALAIPPILTNAYVGVQQTDRDAVDAARGMGLSGRADHPPDRAAAGAAADLRRHQDVDGQRHRHRHDRAAGRRGHARRPARGLLGLRARGPDRRLDHRRRAGDRRRGRPVGRPAGGHAGRHQTRARRRGPRACPLRSHQEEDPDRPMSKLTPYLAALLAALALGVAACGDDEEEPAGSGEATATAEATQASGIVNNPDNAKVSLKIGSKNFTEQKVLGEIYAQGLAAAGYNTTTDLNLGDQDVALAALKGGEIDAYPEYTGTALTVFFGKDAADLPKDAAGGLRGGQDRVREGRADGVPADAVHELQRGRGDEGDGRQARPEEHLRPRASTPAT